MTLKPSDQFHIGIVVDEFESTLAELSDLLGYEWCEEMTNPTDVVFADGSTAVIPTSFAYSMNAPRLEIIRTVPGTLWEPAAGSGVHHMGYWSDDIEADSDALAHQGWVPEVVGRRPTGEVYWAYHRHGNGPRIELVARTLQPTMERYFATGKVPTRPAEEAPTASSTPPQGGTS